MFMCSRQALLLIFAWSVLWSALGTPSQAHATDLTAAWADNKEKPAWRPLREQLYEELGRENAHWVHPPTVPSTIAYLISQYEEEILGRVPRDGHAEFIVHLVGATYLFEGMSDWSWLARALPAWLPRVRIDLILGSPFASDGPTMDANKHNGYEDLNVSDSNRGQVELPTESITSSMLQISRGRTTVSSRASEPLNEDGMRQTVCGPKTFGKVHLIVNCHEYVYQEVWGEIPEPHLALMFNPGFPQISRRSWDGVLRHLLQRSIPSAVSAERAYENKDDFSASALGAGKVVNLDKETASGGDIEVVQTLITLGAYDAQVIGVTLSPFPYIYQESENAKMAQSSDERESKPESQEIIAKNAVLEFFVGRKAGSPKFQMLPQMDDGELPDDIDEEGCLDALRLPVSQNFQNAMVEACEYENPPCEHLRSVADWLVKCD